MEATALSVGKSVLDGALGYAKSTLAEEVALQLGIQRDHAFIRDELAMMQAFLRAAHGERRGDHEVLMTWVKQVRDVAYDAEDCLQDFSIHLRKPSWWRLPCTLGERRRIAKQMKDLRARVEDVSQRNLRYQLLKSAAGSKSATLADEQSNTAAAAIFGIDEAWRAEKHENLKVDLVRLINTEDENLRVISVWGTSGDLGQASIINEAYENPIIKKKFPCRAWVRILHPFNPNDFIQSLVKQFRSAVGIGILLEAEKTGQELAEEFARYVNDRSFLVVLNWLSTFEEWKGIRACFPNNKKGSRIIVCTPQAEVASLCAGKESQVLELKQLSTDQTIYAFSEKDSEDETNSPMLILPRSNTATTSTINSVASTIEIEENSKVAPKSLTRIKTMTNALEESQLIGRKKEIDDIVKLISNELGQQFSVISVWGMGGLGKTTLVKDVYQNQNHIGRFEKRAFVTVMRPFNLKELLKSLIVQLSKDPSKKEGGTRNKLATMGVEALTIELALVLENKCLIVLDDLSSTTEWDMIIQRFPKMENTSHRIIVTTREENIAKHCSNKQENIYVLNFLEYKDALNLFTRKVFGNTIELHKQYPELVKEANLILKKCSELPLAIVTIGGFLAKQQKTPLGWRKLNEHISAELEMNPELGLIKNILIKSYDGLPYHLKSCFLYLSIFPKGYNINRRRLVQRWIAEGYSSEVRGKSQEEIADNYFMDLIDRSMILPFRKLIGTRKGVGSCQVHDIMREISISKSMDENLIFRLEEGSISNRQGKVRHVAVSSNWEGDKNEFESAVDLAHIRSLTVFSEWRPFFISKKMRLLRVLDLEGTSGLVDHHLEHVGRLLHLKYVSLRGCIDIYHLPDSWGNLRQLQTLDIKDTSICELPKAITKLTKLQYLFGGERSPWCVNQNDRLPDDIPKLCGACCAPQLLKDVEAMTGDPNRHDVCSFWCHVVFPTLASRRLDPYGVVVPKGFRKLKSLHTLGVMNITGGSGKAMLHDIRKLTQLRKLAVTGINQKNCKELCSTLADLSHVESLSLRSSGDGSGLHGSLDGLSTPPKNLQSLKLCGKLVKLPEWIGGLQSLVKLVLWGTRLVEVDATMQVLGKLPNLAILRLRWPSLLMMDGEHLRLSFHRGAFPNLMVLHVHYIDDLESVEFVAEATPKLEVLCFYACWAKDAKDRMFSGLAYLPRLKEFILDNRGYKEGFLKDLQEQLAGNQNRPVLKRCNMKELG